MSNYLPELKGMTPGLRKGRNVYEGYQRGWGLEFGDLRKKIEQDPDYQYALQYTIGRSFLHVDRLMNLFLLIKFYLPKLPHGNIIEFGACRGGSTLFMAALAARFLPGTIVYGLDSFEGMPETNKSVDAHSEGDFLEADFEEVLKATAKSGLKNVEFVKGFFDNTAPAVLEKAGSLALAHIDCDIYEAVKYSYLASKPHMVPGGYVVFDDSVVSSCIGATEAVEEYVIRQDGLLSEQIFPHHVFRVNSLASGTERVIHENQGAFRI